MRCVEKMKSAGAEGGAMCMLSGDGMMLGLRSENYKSFVMLLLARE